MTRAWSLLCALCLACGSGVVGRDYAGEPLAVLQGQLTLAPGTVVPPDVRLALGWYPQWLAASDPGDSAAAQVIVTENVELETTFPAAFRFPVLRPPPSEALAPLGEGLQGRGAFGVLLAYDDVNGNGRLDPIRAGGQPMDRVLGASLLGPPEETFALVYVSSPQPAETGLGAGFNLVKAVAGEAGVVPLETAMRLDVGGGGPVYDALVCEAGWLAFLVSDVCGLSGEGDGPLGFAVDGRIALDGARLQVSLTVTSVQGPHLDAMVSLNGRAIPYSPLFGAYVLEEETTTLVRAGGTVILTASAAGASVGEVLSMPGEFQLSTPTEQQTVSAALPLTVTWTASEGATSYFAGFEAPSSGYSTLPEPGETQLTFDTTGVQAGAATAFVEARIDPTDAHAFVTTAVTRRRAFFFSE